MSTPDTIDVVGVVTAVTDTDLVVADMEAGRPDLTCPKSQQRPISLAAAAAAACMVDPIRRPVERWFK
jgi:hypothetical protein